MTSKQLAPTEQPTSIAAGAVPFGPTRTPRPGPTAAPQLVQTTSTLQIDAKLANGNYAFKASNSTYFVSLTRSAAESILNVKRSDLVTVAPTPTALQSRRFQQIIFQRGSASNDITHCPGLVLIVATLNAV